MAAFASCRRSGAVRVMVLLLCALFIFATLGAPAAQALGVESVAVFGLASVLSAATAALGFKLASNEQGQASLEHPSPNWSQNPLQHQTNLAPSLSASLRSDLGSNL